jgi:sortase A
MTLRRIASYVLLAIGLGSAGWIAYVHLKTCEVQKTEIAPRPAEVITQMPRTGDAIGRIEIARLKISPLVLEGTDASVLRVAAGHVRGTALPGSGGNIAVAAHRDTFFRELGGIRRGDEILLTTLAGEIRYFVDRTEIVEPSNTAVLNRSPDAELTLITCYPFHFIGPAPKRFIVHSMRHEDCVRGVDTRHPSPIAALARMDSRPSRVDARPRVRVLAGLTACKQ